MHADLSPMRAGGSTVQAGAYSSAGLDMETPWHYHDLHQVLYAFEDSVEVISEHARYKVPHQFAAWIPAGFVHRTAIHKVRSGSVFLAPSMIESPVAGVRVIPVSNLMREMIMHAMQWPMSGEDDESRRSYFGCFAMLCRDWLQREVTLVLPSSDDPRITAIADFTRAHLATATLEQVCDAVAMSPRTLRRHFQKAMGLSWEEYRLRLRMYTAIELLDNTSKPIGVVAADVGYVSQAAFAKAFRTIMGIGPAAYRRQRQSTIT